MWKDIMVKSAWSALGVAGVDKLVEEGFYTLNSSLLRHLRPSSGMHNQRIASASVRWSVPDVPSERVERATGSLEQEQTPV